MSSEICLALLLDGPMQAWGHSSRFERRTTALHPTRSGVLGIVAAAMGIDKFAVDERAQLDRLATLRMTKVALPRRDRLGDELPMLRMEDYHTVTGIRRASGKVEDDATVQTYRHYLLDARFGVLLEGPEALALEICAALRNPKWGVWFGRKSCLPATPLVVCDPSPIEIVWPALLRRAGYKGEEFLTQFDRVTESTSTSAGADMIDDHPVGYGQPIGERHAPRWIKREARERHSN